MVSGGDARQPRAPARGLYRRLAGGSGKRSEQESVVAHLQAILNTHVGESMSALGLGIIDFADVVLNFPASAQVLLHSIRTTILQYERRLCAEHPAGGQQRPARARLRDLGPLRRRAPRAASSAHQTVRQRALPGPELVTA